MSHSDRVVVVDVSPTPTPAVRVAIERALDELWPRPTADWHQSENDHRWRVASRPWMQPSIPIRKWGRG